MSVTTLFIIFKTWKQPRYPLVGKHLNKLWYIQIMEYYSAPKTNKKGYQAMKRHEESLNDIVK